MKELSAFENRCIMGGVNLPGSVGLNDFLIVDSNPHIPNTHA